MVDYLVITILRHGVTEANLRREYLGWTDSMLVEGEKKSLLALRDKIPVQDLVLCSDLNRTIDSAQIVFPNEPYLIPQFREMNFGQWEGKTYDDLKSNQHYRRWVDDLTKYQPPGGESLSSFQMRIEAGLKILTDIIENNQAKKVALVTHGGVIRYLLSKFSKEDKSFWDWDIKNSSAYELHWQSLEQFKEGHPCILLREVHSTVRVNG